MFNNFHEDVVLFVSLLALLKKSFVGPGETLVLQYGLKYIFIPGIRQRIKIR
jgi:hypothetical protein